MDVSSEHENRIIYRPRIRWSDEQNTRYVYDLPRERTYERNTFNYMNIFIFLIVIILVIMLVSAISGPTVVSRTQYVV